MRLEKVTLSDLERLTALLAQQIQGNEIILLNGELGAGKTTLAKLLLNQFGYSLTHSPTYSLHNCYQLPQNYQLLHPTNSTRSTSPSRLGNLGNASKLANPTIHHFDLYRIESFEELETLSFYELLSGPYLCLVEWACRMDPAHLPLNKIILSLTIGSYPNQDSHLRWLDTEGVYFETL
jgi:tRNA A37 threonylcarbamoyladenosine biosynthesis protein TsaE